MDEYMREYRTELLRRTGELPVIEEQRIDLGKVRERRESLERIASSHPVDADEITVGTYLLLDAMGVEEPAKYGRRMVPDGDAWHLHNRTVRYEAPGVPVGEPGGGLLNAARWLEKTYSPAADLVGMREAAE